MPERTQVQFYVDHGGILESSPEWKDLSKKQASVKKNGRSFIWRKTHMRDKEAQCTMIPWHKNIRAAQSFKGSRVTTLLKNGAGVVQDSQQNGVYGRASVRLAPEKCHKHTFV
ncbi:hypothetical protein, unlikely [Trypanosoma brucei gambiense DAL972]|uniref:Uncharacterized protein n=1 Tax=Trypanosoma brucei gambiense (strain MHOM/CI/86/DAL972) TaxID=679716 RepID=D0A8I3_TRYB9|nr:hypothetical protein, unlikely [Trypanosoma brucei gambiense DAL972]CBH17984.1 hypothetical protein, unlikely [Trypanosoma brucei gambiense DAL972]|eukprot:XP_011780248.1 hypothetical protein, unlikely [Trypanosoma brucei gambiense DAL972]